jgi:hypothetical protein
MIKSVPQGLKPSSIRFLYGTAEPVPFVQSIFPQPLPSGPKGLNDDYVYAGDKSPALELHFQAFPRRLNHGRIAPTAVRYDVHSSPAPELRQLFVA